MFEILKIFHLLCLLLGGAASIGGAVLLKRVKAQGGPPPPMVADAMGVLGRIGIAAIVVLWLTGVPLAIMSGAFAASGPAFNGKLIAATVVLGAVPLMVYLRTQAAKGKRPSNPVLIQGLGSVGRIGIVIAIGLAVIAFN
jgi:hypothetical protein